ncbi:MAG: SagB/ThcOx family dehydrogenase [Candidatus Riflebacteria bacterium]|nr:SagB/ThcOx family dehydrogenase [Candidatus Riflebacteria bacterium]
MPTTPTATAAGTASAPAPAGPDDVVLPPPRQEGGKPLLQALRERKSEREFSPEPLPLQQLSDLLWAAAGISRPESGKRTIPSAKNWQMVEVVAILPDGAYLYDAKANLLRNLAKDDLRPLAGKQGFVASAPLTLVYVSDPLKLPIEVPEEDRTLYAAVETGCITQNVYLFCASEGLATVVRASVDRPVLAMALHLPLTHRITLVQTVGKRP